MARPIIEWYTNRVEITGLTHDAAWHLVDVSSFVTTGATGVIVHFENTDAATEYFAGVLSGSMDSSVLSVNQGRSRVPLRPSSSAYPAYKEFWAEMDGSGQIYLYSQNAALRFYIIADHSADLIYRPLMPQIGAPAGSYTDADLGPSGLNLLESGDKGLVEMAVVFCFADVKLRPNGSTFDPNSFTQTGTTATHGVVKVDVNDIFEMSQDTSDKFGGNTFLIAYCKSGSGITMLSAPVDVTMTQDDAFHTATLTDLPSGATGAFFCGQNNDAATRRLAVRNPSSTNPATYTKGWFKLNYLQSGTNGQKVAYLSETTNGRLTLLGYSVAGTPGRSRMVITTVL